VVLTVAFKFYLSIHNHISRRHFQSFAMHLDYLLYKRHLSPRPLLQSHGFHHVYLRSYNKRNHLSSLYTNCLFNQLPALRLPGSHILESRGSEEQVPFVHDQKYRNGNRGKDRTILRSHPPRRSVRILDVCRHLYSLISYGFVGRKGGIYQS
jgi:hypothetical protein